MPNSMNKSNLAILVVCQLISATGSIIFVTLGGIIGAAFVANPAWATLPISLMVVATAASTVPATLIMRRLGRSRGFALASCSAVVGVLMAAWALKFESFWLFGFAAVVFGINMAFTQQYRYAAAESVAGQYIPRAVSFVLLGSIGGALLGPELTARGETWFPDVPYAGTMIVLAGLYLLQAILFLRLEAARASSDRHSEQSGRALRAIVTQPVFIVAVLGGTAAYGLMSLIMTATPLSMHVRDGYSVAETAAVIRAHVLGMYAPSLVSGILIEKLGLVRLMSVGIVLLFVTSAVGLLGQSVMHYSWALILLGVGWNLLYVGGTTMLTYTYTLEERFRAQAVNEFLVFGTAAATSLLAGTVIHYFGWFRLMLVPLPVLLAIGFALYFVRDNALIRPREAAAGT